MSAVEGLVRVVERPRLFIRSRDVRAELGCSKNHVRNLIDRGVLRASKLGSLLLIDYASYEQYLATATPVTPKVADR